MGKEIVQIKTCSLCVYFDSFTPYRLSVGECLKKFDYGSGSQLVCEDYVSNEPTNGVQKICLKN